GGCGGGEKCDWSRHLAKERKDTICHYISISCRGTSRPHGFRECQRLFDVAAQTLQHHSVGSLGVVPLGSLDHLGYACHARIVHHVAERNLAELALRDQRMTVLVRAESEFGVVEMHHVQATNIERVAEP